MIATIIDSGSFWGAIVGLGAAILGGAFAVSARLGKVSQSLNDLQRCLDAVDRRLTYLEHRAWTTHPRTPGPVPR